VAIRSYEAGRGYDVAEFPCGDGVTILQRQTDKGPVHFSQSAYSKGYIEPVSQTA
jgi:hypothetical protein